LTLHQTVLVPFEDNGKAGRQLTQKKNRARRPVRTKGGGGGGNENGPPGLKEPGPVGVGSPIRHGWGTRGVSKKGGVLKFD